MLTLFCKQYGRFTQSAETYEEVANVWGVANNKGWS